MSRDIKHPLLTCLKSILHLLQSAFVVTAFFDDNVNRDLCGLGFFCRHLLVQLGKFSRHLLFERHLSCICCRLVLPFLLFQCEFHSNSVVGANALEVSDPALIVLARGR